MPGPEHLSLSLSHDFSREGGRERERERERERQVQLWRWAQVWESGSGSGFASLLRLCLSFYFLLIYALESALALRSDTLKSSWKIPRWSCWIIKKRWSLRYGPRKPEQHSLLQKWNQRDSIRIRYLESHRKRHFWKSLFSRKEGFEINLCYESSSQGRSDRLRPSGKHKAREGNLTKSNQF